jgi:hypothetical protein
MKRILLCPLALACAVAMWASAPIVRTAPNHQRVGKTDAPGSSTSIQLYAAKGEFEPFQVIVTAPAGGLTNVRASASDLSPSSGPVIPAANVRLYREYYVTVSPASSGYTTGLGAGLYPDALIPFTDDAGQPLNGSILAIPFDLSAGNNQPLWADLKVPDTAAAGTYTGTVTVTSDQGNVSVTVSLTVWNFALPKTPKLRSSFGLHGANFTSANEEVLITHRLMPVWTDYQYAADFVTRLGLNETALPIEITANKSNCTIGAAPSVPTIQALVAQYPTGLNTYVYVADEIGACTNLYPDFQAWARNIHQAGSNSLITMAPVAALLDDGGGAGRSAVDIWVMLPLMFVSEGTYVAQAQAKGDSVWSYNDLNQDSYSPKWLIDFAPINYRIQAGFLSETYGLKGLLYWGVDNPVLWSNAWTNVMDTEGQYYFAGEGLLVYPGAQVGQAAVVPSMRLKWLREGEEDYEYVEILKSLGEGTWAMGRVSSVATSWSNWTQDSGQLASVRLQLGQEIDRLSNGGDLSSGFSIVTSGRVKFSGKVQ